jgi:hypothetical protein
MKQGIWNQRNEPAFFCASNSDGFGASPMTVDWTLPGKSPTELGDTAAQQSANFVVKIVLVSIAASGLSSAVRKINFDPQTP